MAALQSFQARQGIRVIMATLFVVDLNVLALMGNGIPGNHTVTKVAQLTFCVFSF